MTTTRLAGHSWRSRPTRRWRITIKLLLLDFWKEPWRENSFHYTWSTLSATFALTSRLSARSWSGSLRAISIGWRAWSRSTQRIPIGTMLTSCSGSSKACTLATTTSRQNSTRRDETSWAQWPRTLSPIWIYCKLSFRDLVLQSKTLIKTVFISRALQLNGDMSELLASLNGISNPFIAGSCSALVKVTLYSKCVSCQF